MFFVTFVKALVIPAALLQIADFQVAHIESGTKAKVWQAFRFRKNERLVFVLGILTIISLVGFDFLYVAYIQKPDPNPGDNPLSGFFFLGMLFAVLISIFLSITCFLREWWRAANYFLACAFPCHFPLALDCAGNSVQLPSRLVKDEQVKAS